MWRLCFLVLVTRASTHDQDIEMEARKFMDDLNTEFAILANIENNAEWDYESNMTDFNLQKKIKIGTEHAAIYKEKWTELIKYPWQKFQDFELRRQFEFNSVLGTPALPEADRTRLEVVVTDMINIYSTTKLQEWQGPSGSCNATNPTIPLEPDLEDIFSTHYNESCMLQYYWEGWFGTVGKGVKSDFVQYVTLVNEAARLNNFTDKVAMWNEDFEMDTFEDEIQRLYQEIRPFYQQLHAYVRRRLRQQHNTRQRTVIGDDGNIPAHILGDVWAQEWQNVYDIAVPYPGKVSVDVTPALIAQDYTPLKMFKLAESFYLSLNLSAMTKTFWEKSIFEKPKDRDIVCDPSAWDFSNGEDYRINFCTRVNLEDFKTCHHEMGHIEYYMAYSDLPFTLRGGANSGFHEAVGDTMSLSVSTATHLLKIGLLDSKTYVEDEQTEINSLFGMALEKVAFLPFAYVLDLFRWDVFRGRTTPRDYNCRFWQLRQDLQGIVPPIDRDDDDFDAGGKFHVVADVPYIRYFVSFIIQFQFYEALCIEAGQYNPNDTASKPLHQCDFYQSTKAGDLMRNMLQMGASRPWQDAFQDITGKRKMDVSSLLKYFDPLYKWLVNENKRTGETVGWNNNYQVNFCSKKKGKPSPKKTARRDWCRYNFPDEKSNK